MAEPWREISKRKLAERDARIPKEWHIPSHVAIDTPDVTDIPRACGILTEREIDITENYDATALAKAIATRKFWCVEVTRAFCKRAAIAQQLTNCLTEIMFEDALRRAAWLDHRLELDGQLVGPLHGLPISLKDPFRITGVDSSIGMAALTFKPSTSSSPLVTLLLNAGAVIHCKTNVPQTMMSLDSENNIFGRTMNPINPLVTSGGSSGGEGVLVRMKGSVLGVGTDIGGSIRVPAYCNGIYGIKPSADRVPWANQEGGVSGGWSALKVRASAGPITRSVRDCVLFFKAIEEAKAWEYDARMTPGLWSPQAIPSSPQKKFTFGIFMTDNVITPLPPIAKMLNEVGEMLRKAGHRVVSSPAPPTFERIESLTSALFGLDGGNEMLDLLESHSEPLVPWIRPIMRRKKHKTLEQTRDLKDKREMMMQRMLKLWKTTVDGKSADVDAIIAPIAPHPVAPVDRWGSVSYTSAFVFLDYPAGVVPVRTVDELDLQDEMAPGEPIGKWDELNRGLWDTKRVDRRAYLRTPLSIQVITPRLQETRLCVAMQVIDDAIHAGGRGGVQPVKPRL